MYKEIIRIHGCCDTECGGGKLERYDMDSSARTIGGGGLGCTGAGLEQVLGTGFSGKSFRIALLCGASRNVISRRRTRQGVGGALQEMSCTVGGGNVPFGCVCVARGKGGEKEVRRRVIVGGRTIHFLRGR